MTKKPVMMGPNHSDEFQTPPYGVQPILPYLRPGWVLWECAWGGGSLARALKAYGFKTSKGNGYDFLKAKKAVGDCIVTNPPYSLKDEFLAKCYELGGPFALLMPLTALEGQRRQPLYAKYGIELILFTPRIDFILPENSEKKSSSWFATAWFTHGLNIGRELTFTTLEKPYAKKKD